MVPSWHVTGSHVIITSLVKWPHTISKICVKMPSKSMQNQGSNGFSSSDLRFMLQSKSKINHKLHPLRKTPYSGMSDLGLYHLSRSLLEEAMH